MSSPHLDVRYVADLVRLTLSEAEVAQFQQQLDHVLAYVQQLGEVDVSGIEPMAHTSPVFNVFRADEARPGLTPEEALANAPHQASGLFIVPKVVE